jgi:hypothetical protein
VGEFAGAVRQHFGEQAEAWTAFYAGTGPRPRTGKLPDDVR